jgi:hypothetical protein
LNIWYKPNPQPHTAIIIVTNNSTFIIIYMQEHSKFCVQIALIPRQK